MGETGAESGVRGGGKGWRQEVLAAQAAELRTVRDMPRTQLAEGLRAEGTACLKLEREPGVGGS